MQVVNNTAASTVDVSSIARGACFQRSGYTYIRTNRLSGETRGKHRYAINLLTGTRQSFSYGIQVTPVIVTGTATNPPAAPAAPEKVKMSSWKVSS